MLRTKLHWHSINTGKWLYHWWQAWSCYSIWLRIYLFRIYSKNDSIYTSASHTLALLLLFLHNDHSFRSASLLCALLFVLFYFKPLKPITFSTVGMSSFNCSISVWYWTAGGRIRRTCCAQHIFKTSFNSRHLPDQIF